MRRPVKNPSAARELRRLARAWGVQTSYHDVTRTRRHAATEALLAVLRALGAPVNELADVPDALRAHERARARPGIDPVHVAWDGELPPLRGRLFAQARVICRLRLEDGSVHEWAGVPRESTDHHFPAWRTGLPRTIPLGYHALELHEGSRTFHTKIISAPLHAYIPREARNWGLFLPLHSVRSRRSRAAPDYTDLEALTRWTGQLGGTIFGTLPLLATFLAAPFEPSPYAPASRLFWSDFFIDIDLLSVSPDARLDGARHELAQLESRDTLDYQRVAAIKRRIIDDCAQRFFERPDATSRLASFTAEHGAARDYARFRAVCDRRRAGWHDWPSRLRDGDLRDGDFDAADERYHLYAAWVAELQLAKVAAATAGGRGPATEGVRNPGTEGARNPGAQGVSPSDLLDPSATAEDGAAALYLDLPLGVHRDGFDPWRWRDLFASGISAGAPPDAFFPDGQDWGFAPLHPIALRASGHQYTIDCIRHHVRRAGVLRLDHVMALQRLLWIPQGFGPEQGVYVRYPLEEQLAILTLESARHHTAIVGEDLGTVSREVRSALGRHAIQRMFVLQFEASPDAEPGTPPRRTPALSRLRLPEVPRAVMASLNTHDMPTFATYWRELEMAGKLPAEEAIGPLLEYLAASRARYMLINLEDLWLETRPQNVPGTPSRNNWRRPARYGIEEMRSDAEVLRLLRLVARSRAGTGAAIDLRDRPTGRTNG